jgi:peptidoglycan/xylan/chitin deacetylase (PgdA/CDA1 family)
MIFRDDDINYKTNLEQFKRTQDLFNKYQVTHTIALIAKDMDRNPALVKYILENDISVQLHCWTHIRMRDFSEEELSKDIGNGVLLINLLFHKRPTILFPPWNEANDTLKKVCNDYGLKLSYEKISLDQYIRVKGDVAEDTINFHFWDKGDSELLEQALIIYAKNRNRNS